MTAIDLSVAAVTVTTVVPEIPACAAVIVAVPVATPVSRPSLPAVLLTTAILVAEELQLTELVRSCVLPSENVPVAASCNATPAAIDGEAGAMAMELRVAGVTVIEVVPLIPLSVAVIVALPGAIPVSNPSLPGALLIVTIPAGDELHVTRPVRS